MATTLHDVAKLANVDISSASRTLSHHPRAEKLRPETRQRIFEAAEKLGYHRNQAAAAMRTGLIRTLAIITTSDEALSQSLSSMRVLYGILSAAARMEYGLKMYTDEDLVRVIQEIKANQIRHVISLSTRSGSREETATLCRQHGLQLVFVYETTHDEFPAVSADNYGISREMVRLLVSRGHRRIALVCGEYQYWHYMTEKYNAYVDALNAFGISPDFSYMVCRRDIGEQVDQLLSLPVDVRPTAFFCIGDGFAMQVQRQAIRHGLRVPGDISVTGFGNTESGNYALSPLTTVDEHQVLMGEEAFRLVLEGRTELAKDEDGTYRVKGTIIERESVYDFVNT